MKRVHVLIMSALAMSAAPAAAQSASTAAAGPLDEFSALTGSTWIAQGTGFSTALSYRWLLSGRIIEATNEVRGADGNVSARYRGAYVWDPGRGEVVFWTAAESGELHRGRAWWRDGVLWHEAEVSGGAIEGYASAARPVDGRIEYYAAYDRRDAGPYLLDSTPLVYSRAADPAADGPLHALTFMAGCWRGEFRGGASLEEFYTSPSTNLIVGVSRFMRDGRAVQYEFSRITADSAGVVLLPFPGGRPSEHGFRLTRSDEGSALFEAPDHDFPKRIQYSRGADGALTARIDGGDGDARVQQWRMIPVSCSAARPGAD